MAFAAVLGQALELGSRAAAGGSRAKRLRSITACAMLRHAATVFFNVRRKTYSVTKIDILHKESKESKPSKNRDCCDIKS